MAWIESHQELRDHPKTKRAARQLGIEVPHLIGHLQCLWWWVLDYAPDGDLSDFDDFDLADAAMWTGDAVAFVAALQSCGPGDSAGFIDDDRQLHDWAEYGGKHIKRRDEARKRQKRKRSRDSAAESEPVTQTSRVTPANVTDRQDRTGEERTGEDMTEAAPASPPSSGPSPNHTTAAAASDTADILMLCDWVGDEFEDVRRQVLRSFQLVDTFRPRDGPVEAEKYGLHWSQKRRKPSDWYRAWLNWIKKAVEFDARTQPSRNGRPVTGAAADALIDNLKLED